MILADTSLWVDHFHARSREVLDLLLAGQLATHPFVVGELLAGNLPERTRSVRQLLAIPTLAAVEHQEVVELVDRNTLYGRGLSWIDAHLLASCLASGTPLLTRDAGLNVAARRVGVATG